MRLEFEATDDGVVERGGCESPRDPPRTRRIVGFVLGVVEIGLIVGFFSETLDRSTFGIGPVLARLFVLLLVKFSAIRSLGTHSSYLVFQPV